MKRQILWLILNCLTISSLSFTMDTPSGQTSGSTSKSSRTKRTREKLKKEKERKHKSKSQSSEPTTSPTPSMYGQKQSDEPATSPDSTMDGKNQNQANYTTNLYPNVADLQQNEESEVIQGVDGKTDATSEEATEETSPVEFIIKKFDFLDEDKVIAFIGATSAAAMMSKNSDRFIQSCIKNFNTMIDNDYAKIIVWVKKNYLMGGLKNITKLFDNPKMALATLLTVDLVLTFAKQNVNLDSYIHGCLLECLNNIVNKKHTESSGISAEKINNDTEKFEKTISELCASNENFRKQKEELEQQFNEMKKNIEGLKNSLGTAKSNYNLLKQEKEDCVWIQRGIGFVAGAGTIGAAFSAGHMICHPCMEHFEPQQFITALPCLAVIVGLTIFFIYYLIDVKSPQQLGFKFVTKTIPQIKRFPQTALSIINARKQNK